MFDALEVAGKENIGMMTTESDVAVQSES